MSHKRNVEGLRNNAEQKKEQVLKQAENAIRLLLQEGRAVNFKTVAEAGGISAAYLYKNQGIRERIEHLRKQSQPAIESKGRASDASKEAIITALREQVRGMRQQIEALGRQNEVAYGLVHQLDYAGIEDKKIIEDLKQQQTSLNLELEKLKETNSKLLAENQKLKGVGKKKV